MLGTDMLTDPVAKPLRLADASITFNVVHIDADIGHAKRAAVGLEDPNTSARLEALGELAVLGDAATVVAPVLVALLQDDDLMIRSRAAQVLGGLESVARPLVVPALEHLLEKTNKTISLDLAFDDIMNLPDHECMESEADWSPVLKLRDATIDAMRQLSLVEIQLDDDDPL